MGRAIGPADVKYVVSAIHLVTKMPRRRIPNSPIVFAGTPIARQRCVRPQRRQRSPTSGWTYLVAAGSVACVVKRIEGSDR